MAKQFYGDIHDFYCINCGEKGLALPRRDSLKKGKFHRKNIWCPHCKMDTIHIECRNDEEVAKFKEDFKDGVYNDENEKALSALRTEWEWKEYLRAQGLKR